VGAAFMTRFLAETSAHILSTKHCVGNAAFALKGMTMQTKTPTLKSTSRITQSTHGGTGINPNCVIAGRSSKRAAGESCAAVIDRLRELIEFRQETFIQMRHGAGYCGVPVSFEDGWLTMINTSIHGTKHTAVSKKILIQLKDGSFIAHIHAVETQAKNGGVK
jgi:hypothetical protein